MTDQEPQQSRPHKPRPLPPLLTAEEAARVRERAERQRQLRHARGRRRKSR